MDAQLIAGEEPGTYRLKGDVTSAQLLHLAKMIARRICWTVFTWHVVQTQSNFCPISL